MPKKIERKPLASAEPSVNTGGETHVSAALTRLNEAPAEPVAGTKKMSVSLPPALVSEVRRLEYELEVSGSSIVELALRELFARPNAREVIQRSGTRRRI